MISHPSKFPKKGENFHSTPSWEKYKSNVVSPPLNPSTGPKETGTTINQGLRKETLWVYFIFFKIILLKTQLRTSAPLLIDQYVEIFFVHLYDLSFFLLLLSQISNGLELGDTQIRRQQIQSQIYKEN